MSTTPRTDAARGFHDMETAVDAEEMAKLETELAEARAKLADEQTRSAYANNQSKTLADVVMRQTDEINGLRAEVQKSAGEWATLMSDVHDYFADEKADRSRGRVTLLLTLLGSLRSQRDEARAEVERLREDKARLDWMESAGPGVWSEGDPMEETCYWVVGTFEDEANPAREFKGLTFRAAIDAARKGTP
jgi:chromosome segregation ATPase